MSEVTVWYLQATAAGELIAATDPDIATVVEARVKQAPFNRFLYELVGGTWQDPAEDEANIARIRAYWKEVSDHVGGYYVNLDNEDLKGVPANYGPNYKRLLEMKNKYDPTNLFRLNSNIKPTV